MTTKSNKKPEYIAKSRREELGKTSYDQIGAGFKNDDGSIFIKLAGTQIVSSFMLYEAKAPEAQPETE